MSTGIFGIGITGLQAAQLGLLTSEHNITNASTPGYNRQRTVQSSNIPVMTGAGAVGQGTHVSTIERMYNEYLTDQVNSSQANVSELESYYSQIKQIDDMLADPSSGLSPALQDFFRGVQQVAANPSSISSRQSTISSAETLVSRFHSIQNRLDEMSEGVNSQIMSTVSAVNSYTQQIANLNERIVIAQASANQPANDLLDQRDQLVYELNKLVKVSTTTNLDGSYNVFMGTGQQLVIGLQPTTMTAIASNADPSRIVVGLQTAGKSLELPENLITGGQLGGLVRFRAESLDRASNEMGRVAASLALTFNAQHGLGQDLLGQSTGSAGFEADFFNMQHMQPTVMKHALNTGNGVVQAQLVYGGAYTVDFDGATYTLTRQSDGHTWSGGSTAALVDAGGAAPTSEGVDLSNVTVPIGGSTAVYSSAASGSSFFTNLTMSDYRLNYDGANYIVTRLSDNRQWSNASLDALSATVATSEGFSLSLASGAMAVNDSFVIQPTRAAARNISINANIAADPRLIAAGSPIRTGAATTNTGTAQITNGQAVQGFASTSAAIGTTLTYNSGTGMLDGFPAGADVWVTAPGAAPALFAGPSVPYTSGASINFAGVTFAISGNPANNDTFTISSNTGTTGVADARNALLLSKLQTLGTVAGGSANLQEAYAQFVSNTGNKTRETQVTSQAQQALLEQAQGSREGLSGVNLDEEAANLLRYQQAYQASAKMLDIGGKLLDTVLSIR